MSGDLPGVGRTGIVLRDPLPWHHLIQIVQTAEATGFESVFVPEIRAREAFGSLAGFAGATSTIRLGTGVVTMWSRSPAVMAMAAATLQDLSAGRFVLGLGSGTPPAAGGESGPGPLGRMRACVRLLRQAFAGQTIHGDQDFGIDGFALGLQPEGGPPPIWLGALGDRMLALTGEVADGVILNWCTPDRVRSARSVLTGAAERAGRDPTHITVSVYVRACLGAEEEVALGALRAATGHYASIPHYRRQMTAMGLGPAAESAAEAMGRGRPEGVSEDLVRALCVTGSRAEALARFDAYRSAGADVVLCYPVPVLEPFSSILGTVLGAAPTTAVER